MCTASLLFNGVSHSGIRLFHTFSPFLAPTNGSFLHVSAQSCTSRRPCSHLSANS